MLTGIFGQFTPLTMAKSVDGMGSLTQQGLGIGEADDPMLGEDFADTLGELLDGREDELLERLEPGPQQIVERMYKGRLLDP